jgi:tetratricopeptide (TPR) repeat protein
MLCPCKPAIQFKHHWQYGRSHHGTLLTKPLHTRLIHYSVSDNNGRNLDVQETEAGDVDRKANLALDTRARSFAKGVKEMGIDPEVLLAKDLGFDSVEGMKRTLSDEYVSKSIEKLLSRADELEREKNERNSMFQAGKLYYERGMYKESVKALEQALVAEGALSPLGGDIQMWLALAYQAVGQEKKCIDTYKFLESNHPVPAVRKQAADLRYIMEAPKISLKPDEKVSIPVFDDLDRNVPKSKSNRPTRPRMQSQKKKKKTWDEEFWDSYTPPGPLKNKYVWIASCIVGLGLAWYSARF